MSDSIIKREESPETFLRTILRTSTLPPAEFADDVSASSAASTYKEEDVEPPVWLPNIMFAQQHSSSRASSTSSNGAYQGSSPRKYRLDGRFSRDLFFPAFADANQAPQEQFLDQPVSQDAYGNQQQLQLQFPPFMQQHAQQSEQIAEEPFKLHLQLDGSYRHRRKSEEIHDLVVFSRNMGQTIDNLTARVYQAEMDNISFRNSIVQLVQESTGGSQSAPGPATRYHDAMTSRFSSPSTPTKEHYEPFQTFQLSSPGPQDDEPFGSKLTVGKNSQKGEKTRARKALKIKVPDGKKSTVPLGMATPSNKLDSGYLTGNMASGFPNSMTPTSGQLTSVMGPGFAGTPMSSYLSSPITPGRTGPHHKSQRGVTSVIKRKNHALKDTMPPARTVVPNVPLTDTEVIVYFFQSVARPAVALRLYARHWCPAAIADTLNAHRNIEGGYLRNTCSVKCITAINRGKDKYGTNWHDAFKLKIEKADDVTATDMIQYAADDMDGVSDFDVRALTNGLRKHPDDGPDAGIFTRCVKYCVEHDAPYTLRNVHKLALALQNGVEPEKLGPEDGEEAAAEDTAERGEEDA